MKNEENKETIDDRAKGQEEWEENTLKPWLKKAPEREIYKKKPSKGFYSPLDRVDKSYLEDIGFPGQYPYTRGLNPTEFRSRLWAMSGGMGFGTPEETNKLYKTMFAKGSNRFTTKIDLPCQVGLDPDNPMAEGEVGVIGTSIPSLREMEITLDGIPMEKAAIAGLIGQSAAISWAMCICVAKKQSAPLEKLRLSIMSDCLNEYISRSMYIFPPEHSQRLSIDLTEYVFRNVPKATTMMACGYPIAEGGATLTHAAALMLASAYSNFDKLLERGFSPNDIAKRAGFNIHVSTDFFQEIAKFRALRRIWARTTKEKYGVTDPKGMQFKFGPGTGGSLMTAQMPENNITRGAIAGMAAILGGAHSLTVSGYDEALAIPTPKAATISLATQQILAYETGIPDVVDPLGGSYYMECLTDQIEEEILDYLNEIEKKGGLLKAIQSGWVRSQITRDSYQRQKEIDSGERKIVGVNINVPDDEPEYEIHRADSEVEKDMIRRVQELRKTRDNDAVKAACSRLGKAARTNENLMPYIIEAVNSYATVEDIFTELLKVFGKWGAPFLTRI